MVVSHLKSLSCVLALISTVALSQDHDPVPGVFCQGEGQGVWNLQSSDFRFATSRLPIFIVDGRESTTLYVNDKPAAIFSLKRKSANEWYGVSETNDNVRMALKVESEWKELQPKGVITFNDWKNHDLKIPVRCELYNPT